VALRFCIIICVTVLGFGTSSSIFAQEKTRISVPSLPRAETAQLYNNAWWKEQYKKIYDRPQCRHIIPHIDRIRKYDRKSKTFIAPFVWALGMYLSMGECGASDLDQALAIFTDLAKRGEGIPAVYLAQFYYIKYGAHAPLTRSWIERAKNAMPLIITENWRKDFYQPLADDFQKRGTPFSPQLERIFSWGEKILSGGPDRIYKFGIALLDHGKNVEDKVLGCHWLYKAMNKGDSQARYRFARQMLLGEGVMQDPRDGHGYLYPAVNHDHNIDAILFVSQLLEKGDVFKRSLSDAYIALLRAKKFGAIVADDDLSRLRNQLTKSELYWAEKDAFDMKMSIFFSLTPELAALSRSRPTPSICQFQP